uniref:Uncharacterized protein n=1 Tax=Anguilla anguilla TaxID=7936 RepID=A0A0E9UI46_ANGAN
MLLEAGLNIMTLLSNDSWF